MLEKEGKSVQVYDTQVDQRSLTEVLTVYKPDIVGITCSSSLVYSTFRVAQWVKHFSERIKVVVGGVHPTVLPEEILIDSNIDMVVRGEGERTMVELVRALESNGPLEGIQGLSFRGNSGIIHNPPRPPETDLDALPFPARHLIPMDRYHISPDWFIRRPFDRILTARGCPYRCIFCAAQLVSGGRYRVRSIDNVMEEIDHLYQRYKIKWLLISDDTFVISKARAMEFCDKYMERGYHKKIPWQVANRVDTVDREILSKMKEAGCFIISFGIESGVPRLLKVLNKGITIEQSIQAVRWAKEVGLRVRATLILGIPTETREESLKTIKFAQSLPLDQVRFALATPFPGTQLYQMAMEEGQLKVGDWTSLSLMAGYRNGKLAYVPKGRDEKELKILQRRANLGFYLQPRIILSYLKQMRSLKDMGRITFGLWEFGKASLAKYR